MYLYKTLYKLPLIVFLAFTFIGCGGSSGTGSKTSSEQLPPTQLTYQINGFGVKGPLTNATVQLYSFNETSADGLGDLIDEGTTNNKAQISNLAVTGNLSEYYVIVFTANTNTLDYSTQSAPVISSFRTLLSSADIRNGNEVTATPLSSLVFEIIIKKVSQDLPLKDSIEESEQLVKSMFGLGISADFSILSSPAFITDTAQPLEKLTDTLLYRKSVEAFSTLTFQMAQEISNKEVTAEELVSFIAEDVLDGKFDAKSSIENVLPYTLSNLSVFQQPVNDITIANSGTLKVKDLIHILATESSDLLGFTPDITQLINDQSINKYNYFAMSIDIDNDGIINIHDNDKDNDGISDELDAFPIDSNEFEDFDLDGIGNNADLDDDNDGVSDEADMFPLDKAEWLDTDRDGIGNNSDNDDDNDTIADSADAFPLDSTEWLDTDNDGIGNNTDSDDDNDGFADNEDRFPLDSTEWLDTDNDGIGNNTDTDDDNDGVADNEDEMPLDPTETLDFDKDGIGDISDEDDDNDGIADTADNIHVSAPNKVNFDYNEQVEFKVRGFYTDGSVLDARDLWHVQYSVYDKARNEHEIPFYSENGYFNARFNHDKKEWIVAFPAPDYSGQFEVEFSLYCSSGQNFCGDHYDYGGNFVHKQKSLFTVACSSDVCGYTPDPEPGTDITANELTNFFTTSVVRSNGDIIAIYSYVEANKWRSEVVRSTNKGYTWEVLGRLPTSTLSAKIIETEQSNELIVFATCGLKEFCLYKSNEGKYWTTEKHYPSDFANCNDDLCDVNNIIVTGFLENKDGQFKLFFHKRESGNKREYGTYLSYVTTSADLKNWSQPINIFDDNNTTNLQSVIQIDDGRYIAMALFLGNATTQILISDDAENWSNIRSDLGGDFADLVYKDGKLRAFYQLHGVIFEVNSVDLKNFTAPETIVSKSSGRFSVVDYANGDLGIIYNLYLNYQYDIFYENLEIKMP